MGRWYEGVVESPDGKALLMVPKGALSKDYMVLCMKSIETPPSCAPYHQVGDIYEITPPGARFNEKVTLEIAYDEGHVAVDEDKVNMYFYNPFDKGWVKFKDTTLNTTDNKVSASFLSFAQYYSVVALLETVDPPSTPVIEAMASPTEVRLAEVKGATDNNTVVEVRIGGSPVGEVESVNGTFAMQYTPLNIGDNVITVVASNPYNQTSDESDSVSVTVQEKSPTDITQLAFMTSDYQSTFAGPVDVGDKVYMQLTGTDSDATAANLVSVTLKSFSTDPDGIFIQLKETGENTGVFRGEGTVAGESSYSAGSIAVETDGETILLASPYTALTDSLTYDDTSGPLAPTVTVGASGKTFSMMDFENGSSGTCEPTDGSVGAKVTVYKGTVENPASTGERCLKIEAVSSGSTMATRIIQQDFKPVDYSHIAFDYRIPPGLTVNFYMNWGSYYQWFYSMMTDWGLSIPSSKSSIVNLYRKYEGEREIIADGQWHTVVYSTTDIFGNTYTPIHEVKLADYSFWGNTHLGGGDNGPGAAYYIDNIRIFKPASTNNHTFQWTAPESGIAGYSYTLDQQAGTIPDTTSEGTDTSKSYTGIPDGLNYFHIRALDANGNWGSTAHFPLLIDSVAPVISDIVETPLDVSCKITFATNERARGYLHYGATSSYGQYIVVPMNMSHDVRIEGLEAGNTYHYKLTMTDEAGNTTVTSDSTFDTLTDIYELSFRNGDGGEYSDSCSTALGEKYPDYCYSYINDTRLDEIMPDDRSRMLLWFPDFTGNNDGQVPPDADIQSAHLWVTVWSQEQPAKLNIYGLLKECVPGFGNSGGWIDSPGEYGTTWAKSKDYYGGEGTDVEWDSPGAGTAGADYDSTATASVDLENGTYTLKIDVTSLVSDWVSGARPNYGFLLKVENKDLANDIFGTNYGNSSCRPKLVVVYEEQP